MPDGTSVDQLYIEVNAKASKANDAIDRLCGKLDRLSTSLRKVNGAQLTGLATGVQRLGSAMNTMNQVKTADFTRLAHLFQFLILEKQLIILDQYQKMLKSLES